MVMGLRTTGPWIVPQMNIDTLPDQVRLEENLGYTNIRSHTKRRFRVDFVSWGPFLESPGNLPGPISNFGDKC